jgi:hypothetical protein
MRGCRRVTHGGAQWWRSFVLGGVVVYRRMGNALLLGSLVYSPFVCNPLVAVCKNHLGESDERQKKKKDKNHAFGHANMQHNWTRARRVEMRGCRRVTHGGAQWLWSAKIIWMDLMKNTNHTFAHANLQHNCTRARRVAMRGCRRVT